MGKEHEKTLQGPKILGLPKLLPNSMDREKKIKFKNVRKEKSRHYLVAANN